MTARPPGAPSTASAASRMPSQTSTSSAFSRSGLFSVMVATGALISTCTLLVICSSLDRSPPGEGISSHPSPLRGEGRVRGGELAVERLHERGEARGADVGLVGLVEGRAVEESLVALHDLEIGRASC